MSSSEFISRPPDEAIIGPVSSVHSRCISEVQQGLLEAQTELNAGQLDTYSGNTLGYLFLDMTKEAAQAGEVAQVESHIDTLLKLPSASKSTLAAACFEGVKVGSQYAFNTLRGALEAEKIKAQQDAAERKEQFPHMLRPHVSVDLLESVIIACEENGTPPDSWIDEYALDKEWQWKHYTHHYSRLAKREDQDASPHQKQLETKVGDLLQDDAFLADFVYDNTWYALRVAKDPALRDRLVRHFTQIASEVPLTSSTFTTLIWVGSEVLKDKGLGNPDLIGFFESTIEGCAQTLQDHGMDPFALAKEQLSWRTMLKAYYGASPQEILDSIDLQTSQLLSSDMPDKSDGTMATILRNRDFVTQLRDGQLEVYAENYAERGDFESARLFLGGIVGEPWHEQSIKSCLAKASTVEHVSVIQPDEMTLAFNPELGLQFAFARSKLANDTNAIVELAMECARTIRDGNKYIKHDYIKTAYEIVAAQDNQRALYLANNLLSTLRGSGSKYSEISYLSDALIEAGDANEPARAYNDIDRTALNKSYRLLDIWRLANKLRASSLAD